MKAIIRSVLFTAVLAVSLYAQTPEIEDQQLLNLVQQLTTKQAELIDNEGKIETKVNSLAETIQTARILMSRAGGLHGKKPPAPK